MRQESQFHTRAKSPLGARGLMQLMPATATSLTEEYEFTGKAEEVLYEPQLKVTLGQQYLAWLLDRGEVDGNLFKFGRTSCRERMGQVVETYDDAVALKTQQQTNN